MLLLFPERLFLKNSMKISKLIILLIVVIIACFLRLYKLDSLPPGMYVDEASQGYNAYSILLTGKDEYGKEFPLLLRAFGTYASPLYAYISTIPIGLFDLTIFSTRILSAISGISLVLITYFLIRKLLEQSEILSILCALIVAISPWSILFSRAAFEANFALTLFSLSVLFFVYSLEKNWLLLPATFLLALSTYAYQSERIVAGLFLAGFLYVFRKQFLNKKYMYFSFILFIILFLPQILILGSPGASIRLTQLSYISRFTSENYNGFLVFNYLIIVMNIIKEFLSQYFAYFSLRNIFFDPDPQLIRSIPGLSVFYAWMIVPFLFGIKEIIDKKNFVFNKIILLVLIISPIPAALVTDPFSTLRTLPLFWIFSIIIGFGLIKIIHHINNKYIVTIVVAIFSIMTVTSLYSSYFIQLKFQRSADWGYGYQQLVQETMKLHNEHFVIDENSTPLYIDVAFYKKYDPSLIQAFVNPKIKNNYYSLTEFNPNYKIDNIEIRSVVWRADIYKNQILVGSPIAISDQQAEEHSLHFIFEIKDLAGNTIFRGFRTDPIEKCDPKKNKEISPLCLNLKN